MTKYYSLNQYLHEAFNEKVYKISLSGATTCPNRDGTIGSLGCIFCSENGSGDFAQSSAMPIDAQIENGIKLISGKTRCKKFIAYFQSYTNTYGDISYLTKIFTEAINHDSIVALSIATRPDCLGDEIINLLDQLNKIKPVFVELGFQTSNEDTALFIRRGYKNSCFLQAVNRLNSIHINIVVHVIFGLPWESEIQMLNTVKYLSHLNIHGIKLQLLHVLKNTDLEKLYYANNFHILTMNEYFNILGQAIELLPENMVIHRLTGDGPKNILVEPLWSGNKKLVLNSLNKYFSENNIIQGAKFKKV